MSSGMFSPEMLSLEIPSETNIALWSIASWMVQKIVMELKVYCGELIFSVSTAYQ